MKIGPYAVIVQLAVPAVTLGAQYELKWDNGEWGYSTHGEVGRGNWFANDFRLSGYKGD